METLDDLFLRLEQLNVIGASLTSERDLPLLLENYACGENHYSAEGGTPYLVSEAQQHLQFEILRTDPLSIAFGGSGGQPTAGKFFDLPLYKEGGSPNNGMVAVYAAITRKTVNIADAYKADGFDFSGTRPFDERTGYRSQSFLTVPMKNHEGEIIGLLPLINAVSPETGGVVEFSQVDQRLAKSLASQAAIAMTNRQLVQQPENLFESFIKMINSAIDEKSPYTGGHCQRVPEFTMMLADAVDATTEGPLADFKLPDKDRYELRIAALLHDCGKITTPVYVVDKATKLQTIYDRIDLIDTRFEVIKRDAEIRKWRSIAEGVDADEAERIYRDFCQQCDVDRSILRQSNIGGENIDGR